MHNHIRLINSIRNLTGQFHIALVLSGSKRHNFKIVQKYVIDHGLENNILFVGYIPDEDISGVYKRARALLADFLVQQTCLLLRQWHLDVQPCSQIFLE